MQAEPLKRPLVSVIVTSFNYGAYIEGCLRSVAAQTYAELECVVVDDVSTDASVGLIERFIAAHGGERFRLVRHTENQGQMAAFQTGLAHTRGRFVVFLDADDFLLPHFVDTHVRAHLNGLYEAAFTNSDQVQIGADGELLSATQMSVEKHRGEPGRFRAGLLALRGDGQTAPALDLGTGDLAYYAPEHTSGWMWSTTSAAMFRRDVLDLIMSPECCRIRICADNYLFHFAHALGGTLIVSAVCGAYRRHGRNAFSRNPIIGGPGRLGLMGEALEDEIRAISFRHVVAMVPRLSPLLGTHRTTWLLRRFGSGRDLVELTLRRPTFPGHLFAPGAPIRPERVFCQLTWPPSPRRIVKRTLGRMYFQALRWVCQVVRARRRRRRASPGDPVKAVSPGAAAPVMADVRTDMLASGTAVTRTAAPRPSTPAVPSGPDRLRHYLEKSDTFCMMPWVHMHTWPDGRVLACCLANPDQPLGHLDSGLRGSWNSDAYKQFRLKLLNGQAAPEHCQRCYEFDRAGHYSLRKTANRRFGKHLREALEQTAPDGTYASLKLRHLDFRYSNLCNLKCRSCCHDLSSRWHGDSVALYGDKGLPVVIKPANQRYLEEVLEVLPFVESVYFAGGEPLIQEEHYFILRKLKELGRTDVDLTYATNFTTLSTRKWNVLEYWDGFRSVDLMASLDGSGRRGEILRHGQRWDTIVANRKALMRTPPNVERFTFQVCTTVSAMNIFHIADFQREWIDGGLLEPDQQLFNLLTTPEYYSAQILPREAKLRVEETCRRFMASHLAGRHEQQKKYEAVLSFMHQEDGTRHLPEFVHWMTRLDARRNERFVDVFPEWRELFEQYSR